MKSPKSPKFDPEFFERKLQSTYPGKTTHFNKRKRNSEAGEGTSPYAKRAKYDDYTDSESSQETTPKPPRRRNWLQRKGSAERPPKVDMDKLPKWLRRHLSEDLFTGNRLGSKFSSLHSSIMEDGITSKVLSELSPKCREQAENLEKKRKLKVSEVHVYEDTW